MMQARLPWVLSIKTGALAPPGWREFHVVEESGIVRCIPVIATFEQVRFGSERYIFERPIVDSGHVCLTEVFG